MTLKRTKVPISETEQQEILNSLVPPKKGHRIYFTKDAEMAIVLYNLSNDTIQRDFIYNKFIAYSLNKLVENIINRFKFPYINMDFLDLKQDVLSYLIINLYRYDPEKGRAYSYFSLIAKNYLISHNDSAYEAEKNMTEIFDENPQDSSLSDDMNEIAPQFLLEAFDENIEDSKEFMDLIIKFWEQNYILVFKKDRDRQICLAVVELMKRSHMIESFNKKSLYILLKEITDCKISKIIKVINKMKTYINKQVTEYNSVGSISNINSLDKSI